MTTEEVVLAAARDISTLIQPKLENGSEEEFISFFIRKATELLEEKGALFVGFGLVAEKSDEFFTEDMKVIIEFVEEKTKKEYSFLKGRLLMYFNKEIGTAIWESD